MTGTSVDSDGSVLVSVSSLHRDSRENSLELLSAANAESIVAVTYDCSADSFLRTWRTRIGTVPDNLQIIDVGQTVRSTTSEPTTWSDANVVQTVQRLDDLLGVQNGIESALKAASGETTLIFDSLTAPLEHVSLSEVVPFFARVSTHLREQNAVGYFYFETCAHDSRTMTAFRSLADRAVEVDNDGTEWSIRPRQELVRTTPSLDVLFEALRSRRRRDALRYLLQRTEPVDIEDLATAVASDEHGVTPIENRHRRYNTTLYQLHLPKLDKAGVITHDASNHRVSIRDSARWIAPFLAVAEE
ncbi:DUF7504 family protein [Haladaptatus caseinilyticus]|uniref:DUF7504 family protein n=1 Tax=Haladaptatus caseinilyticus TaxID=2993314 RepID=UPI00224B8B28|nr:hypothetical protein [Haladaptatus caseinilyticus]